MRGLYRLALQRRLTYLKCLEVMTRVSSFDRDALFDWRERAERVHVDMEILTLEFPGLLPHF